MLIAASKNLRCFETFVHAIQTIFLSPFLQISFIREVQYVPTFRKKVPFACSYHDQECSLCIGLTFVQDLQVYKETKLKRLLYGIFLLHIYEC